MLKTKKLFIILFISVFLLSVVPFLIVRAAADAKSQLVERSIKVLPAKDMCCFLLKHEGTTITSVGCYHQSQTGNEDACFRQAAGAGKNTMPAWGECGIDHVAEYIYTTADPPQLETSNVGSSLKIFKSANGKCWYKDVFTLESRLQMDKDYCCFCRRIDDSKDGSKYGCYHQNIVADSKACNLKCNSVVDDKKYSWSWERCSVPAADLLFITPTVSNSTKQSLSWDQDKCYYTLENTDALNTSKTNPLKLKLNVAIPGLEEFSQPEGGVVTSETLSKYLGALYKFLIGLAALLAVIMIAYGGFLWLFADGAGDKISKAKEVIIAAITGLVLALSSYILLNFINPDLVTLKFPNAPTEILPVKINVAGLTNIPTDPTGMFGNRIIFAVDDNHRKLKQATIDKLNTLRVILAGADYLDDTITISDAFRTYEEQVAAYAKYKAGGNLAARPTTSAHEKGLGLDVYLTKNGVSIEHWKNQGCNCVNGQAAGCKNSYDETTPPSIFCSLQKELQTLMQKAGFFRICKEWWHFEAEQVSDQFCDPGVHKS